MILRMLPKARDVAEGRNVIDGCLFKVHLQKPSYHFLRLLGELQGRRMTNEQLLMSKILYIFFFFYLSRTT
jgi:hypothetical protein